MQALTLARACALLGARPTTITKVTGLDRYEVVSLLFSEPGSRKPGQNPSSPEWFFGKACLLDHLDASLFMVMFDRLVGLGVRYPDALVTGYRQYRALRGNPDADGEGTGNVRLTFDRAFDLTRHTYGIWGVLKPSFMVANCAVCRSRYLTALSSRTGTAECCFCKLVVRFGSNDRIRESFQGCSRSSLNGVIISRLASIFSVDR
ncbi:FlhC family transcriptional regulator [Actimicrobium sp. CCI2.3]|uniref:FlhC family transcriptional regulator n=1 Tax=Actimicrobium sp. CCI2.3 TaxID=3048616 RepID=UPI002B24F849|nr:FlhC family transcriptional regulator [Actimicrobium sp. CCI2.3]